ncbi:MAG: hypothetical protein K2H20_03340, partial [Bacilli bacterium]|nr:hypothetical protein [Bacilli bacterium]
IVLSYCEVFYEDMIFSNHKLWNKNVNNEILFIVEKLIDLTDDICPLQTFFCKVLEKYGTMEDGYPHHCDCCGDWIYSYDLYLN